MASLLAGAWRARISPSDLTAPELASILPLLLEGRMAGLGWRRIRGSALAASEDGLKLQGARRLQAAGTLRQEAELEEVLALDDVKQADPIVVKGWAAGRLYLEAGLRPYTDIDLFVRPERYELFVQGLRTRGTTDPAWSTSIDVQEEWQDLPDR